LKIIGKGERRKMNSGYEEAEITEMGSVIIRYYYGETILIPEEIIRKYGVRITRGNEIINVERKEPKIALKPRRFVDGGF